MGLETPYAPAAAASPLPPCPICPHARARLEGQSIALTIALPLFYAPLPAEDGASTAGNSARAAGRRHRRGKKKAAQASEGLSPLGPSPPPPPSLDALEAISDSRMAAAKVLASHPSSAPHGGDVLAMAACGVDGTELRELEAQLTAEHQSAVETLEAERRGLEQERLRLAARQDAAADQRAAMEAEHEARMELQAQELAQHRSETSSALAQARDEHASQLSEATSRAAAAEAEAARLAERVELLQAQADPHAAAAAWETAALEHGADVAIIQQHRAATQAQLREAVAAAEYGEAHALQLQAGTFAAELAEAEAAQREALEAHAAALPADSPRLVRAREKAAAAREEVARLRKELRAAKADAARISSHHKWAIRPGWKNVFSQCRDARQRRHAMREARPNTQVRAIGLQRWD